MALVTFVPLMAFVSLVTFMALVAFMSVNRHLQSPRADSPKIVKATNFTSKWRNTAQPTQRAKGNSIAIHASFTIVAAFGAQC